MFLDLLAESETVVLAPSLFPDVMVILEQLSQMCGLPDATVNLVKVRQSLRCSQGA